MGHHERTYGSGLNTSMLKAGDPVRGNVREWPGI
jgi:hypothetical protein